MKVNVMVIDSRHVRSGITKSGDIVVFTGMLYDLREDDNYIATMLAHEVI